jgi:hypothetical protein
MLRAIPVVCIALAAFLTAPTIASACCADVDVHAPIGWSSDGRLLVDAYRSTDCAGRSTLDVLSPGELRPVTRFDRYDDTRRLAPGASPRELFDDDAWELGLGPGRLGDASSVPAPIRHRFDTTATGLCGGDILAVAASDPSDALDATRWSSHVLVDVSVLTLDGFVVVARDLRVPTGIAEVAIVSVVPSPVPGEAVVRISHDGPESMGDQLHWIALPPSAPHPRSECARGASVIPLRDNLTAPGIEEGNYEIESALVAEAELHVATSEEEFAQARSWYLRALVRALWQDPQNDIIRNALVRGLDDAGRRATAEEVAREVTSDPRGSLASLAPPTPPAPPPPPAVPSAGGVEVDQGPSAKELAIAAVTGGADFPVGDAGMAEAAAPSAETPPTRPGLSCDATGGTRSALAVFFPALVLVGGMGLTAVRRRRRRRRTTCKEAVEPSEAR